MNKKSLFILFGASAALLSVSCQKEDPQPTPGTEGIRFCNVKETFVQGTEFGLFAGEPINKSNVKLTVDASGQLVPSEELYWGAGQKGASSFVCYTPFNSEYSGTSATFSVSENQTEAANVTASDLMCSVTSAKPSDNAVNFKFSHKMATAKFYFDNRINSEITKVEAVDICTGCTFSLTSGEISAPSDAKTVSCYNAGNYWQVVFVPQTVKLTLKVTLANGKEFTKEASKEENFESGKEYSTDKNPIVIEDDTPKAINLVFSISDWTDGGQLNFNGEDEDYTTLAQLAATAGTTATTFSDIKVKDVIVTKVYNNNVHIEDATAALLVYMSNHSLSEGQCINGAISGTIVLYDGNKTVSDVNKAYAELTSIDISKATVTTVGEDKYPLTVITIAQYLADSKTYFNRRVKFEKVTVNTGISSSVQTGSISQEGSSLNIFNKSKAAEIESDVTGDLICFPTIHKSTLQALVYTTDQFTESGSGEDTAFTRLTTMGCYSSTDTETPVAVRTYEEGSDQFSCSKSSSSRSWNLFNLEKGTYVLIDINSTSIVAGSTVSATVNTNGTSEEKTLTVAKKAGGNAWLEDKTLHVGYVINLQ